MSNAAKARALIAWFDDLREATDLLAASLRGPLHKITLTLISTQLTFAAAKSAGVFDAFPRVSHAVGAVGAWVGAGSAIIALYTQRKGEAAALLESKRRDTAAAVAAVQPTTERNDP